MKIDLTDAQVSLIIDGLRALQENAAYENKCTSDSEIHDSNNQMADEVDDLCEYLNCCEEVTPEVAICVKGGLVSSVYANANMDVIWMFPTSRTKGNRKRQTRKRPSWMS